MSLCDMNDLYLAKLLTTKVVGISNGKQAGTYDGSATGFFVEDEEGAQFLVSNRHVLNAAPHEDWAALPKLTTKLESISINGHCLDANGLPAKQVHTLRRPKVVFHANKDVDVAVVSCGNLKHVSGEADTCLSVRAREFATEEDFAGFVPGDQLHIPGYPSDYLDSGAYPIVRTAHLACDPRRGFVPRQPQGDELLAVDGFITPGASGSPVILGGCELRRFVGVAKS